MKQRFPVKQLKNHSGSVIAIVMVVSSAIGGLAYYFLSNKELAEKTTSKFKLESDIERVMNEITIMLSNVIKCRLTFKNSLNPESIVRTLNEDKSTTPSTFSENTRKYFIIGSSQEKAYGNSRLKIKSFSLKQASSGKYFLEILFKNKKFLKGKGGVDLLLRRIRMKVEKDGLGKITSCRSKGDEENQIWYRETSTEIFYHKGFVGINTKTPAFNIDINGQTFVSGEVFSDKFLYPSDQRLKTNIDAIKSPIESLLKIEGVTFNWKGSQEKEYGFIAQNIKQVIPDVVKYKVKKDILTVDYNKMIPLLVEVIKIQQMEIEKISESLEK